MKYLKYMSESLKQTVQDQNLVEFFKVLSSDERTRHGESPYIPKTYEDPECTILDFRRANRSLNAMLDLTQTYFPETTMEQMLKAMFDSLSINLFRCPDIGKFVTHPYLYRGDFYKQFPEGSVDYIVYKNRKDFVEMYNGKLSSGSSMAIPKDVEDRDGYTFNFIESCTKNEQAVSV